MWAIRDPTQGLLTYEWNWKQTHYKCILLPKKYVTLIHEGKLFREKKGSGISRQRRKIFWSL